MKTPAEIIQSALNEGRKALFEHEGKELASSVGIIVPRHVLVDPSDQKAIVAAGEKLGFPVVLKAVSPDILHKTDVGGVKLGINSKTAAEEAFSDIASNAKRLMPEAFINGVMIYEMVKRGKEVILGVTYDRTFGPMLMFGLGGIYVEVLKDVSFRIAPIAKRDAKEMVNEIKANALLKGARGERPTDIESIEDGLLRLSRFVTDFPAVRELDINPLVVFEHGAMALDARIIFERND